MLRHRTTHGDALQVRQYGSRRAVLCR